MAPPWESQYASQQGWLQGRLRPIRPWLMEVLYYYKSKVLR